MPNHGVARRGLADQTTSALRRWRAYRPGLRRQDEHARLAFTELDIRRLDERIDGLLDVLAQLCDYSGQPGAAEEFRALAGQPAEPEPRLWLVQGQGAPS